ncbi:hypothetical protein ACFYTQ_34590 [Nocardia sp. NPDC004068]|uniref:hypothetical protein n=1 Tax=Nocardia sp. NPDC004068 TaxID=3364303 RepID=UPI0036CAA2F6
MARVQAISSIGDVGSPTVEEEESLVGKGFEVEGHVVVDRDVCQLLSFGLGREDSRGVLLGSVVLYRYSGNTEVDGEVALHELLTSA